MPARATKPTVVVAGLGDTGVMVATRLARHFQVIGVATRPALMSGQELGTRLTDAPRWKRTYLVPFHRFRRLDGVELIHGKVTSTDLDASTVTVTEADGSTRTIAFDAFVIATGVANGFWRNDQVQTVEQIDDTMRAIDAELGAAQTLAVVGGGATGVSVAYNMARRASENGRDLSVHLFHGGDEPLPGFHPDARTWTARSLERAGVTVHPNHRAILPDGFDGGHLTTAPIEFSSGQEPFIADVVLWAVGKVRPFTDFLPSSMLDADGFVTVDDHLKVPGFANVFAVGDVAASDPLRSSARNWGHRVIVANVTAALKGRGKERTFEGAPHRWGSILGLQPEGLTVIAANGKRTRIPRWIAERFLLGSFVQRYLYGGLRPVKQSTS